MNNSFSVFGQFWLSHRKRYNDIELLYTPKNVLLEVFCIKFQINKNWVEVLLLFLNIQKFFFQHVVPYNVHVLSLKHLRGVPINVHMLSLIMSTCCP